jgi:hypothetical protein
MRILHVLSLTIIFFCCSSKATPDLFVHLNTIILEADKLKLKVSRDTHSDRVDSIKVTTPKHSFKIDSKLFEQAYAVNLQEIKLTHAIDLNSGMLADYQLYIPYYLHSVDGTEPPDEQELEDHELIIYFTSSEVKRIYTREM